MSEINDFIGGIKHLIKEDINKAPFDRTYIGRVVDADGDTYTVLINGKEYPKTPTLTDERINIGDFVKVSFSQNNPNNRFILNGGGGGGGETTVAGYVAQTNPPSDTNLLWIDTDDDATLQHIVVKDAYIEAINDPDDHIGGVRISANETNNNFAVLKINSEQTTDTSTVTRTTVVRGVATPVESNDAANKAYVDEKTVAPIRYMGILEDDGTITASSDMKYDSVKSALEKGRMSYILTYRQAVDPQNNHYFILTTNENYFNANVVYFTGIDYIDDNHITYYAIKLNSNNVLSTESVDINVDEYEKIINKSTDVIVDKESNTKYPTCKTIYDNFQRRDVLIYDKTSKLNVGGQIVSGDSANGLTSLNASGSIADNQWNITGLDLSGFKYIRVVYCRDAANTGSTAEFNIPLDYSIQNNAYFVSGGVSPSFGDRNRMNCMQCAVSGDKTKFAVCQTYSLYGTAPTTISSIYVVRIYGVY